MNRRRALVMHEMRLMRWLLAAGVSCAIIFCLWLRTDIGGWDSGMLEWGTAEGSYFSIQLLNLLYKWHIFVWIIFGIFTFLQFRDFHGKKSMEYMTSLPFTAREHFVVKALMGYAVIFVSWLVMAVGTLMIWNSEIIRLHKKILLTSHYSELLANETIWHTLRTLGIFGLELLAAYSLFLLLHTMVNNGGAASLFTLGVMAAPAELCHLVYMVWDMAGGYIPDDVGGFEHLARIFGGDSLAMGMIYGPGREIMVGEREYSYIQYWNMWTVAFVLLLILAVCTLVTWRLAKGQDLAGKCGLVPHKGARFFLAVGIGLCAGSGFAIAWHYSDMAVYSYSNRLAGFLVVQVILSVILSFATYKLLKKSVR